MTDPIRPEEVFIELSVDDIIGIMNRLLTSLEAHVAFAKGQPFRVYDGSHSPSWLHKHERVVRYFTDVGWDVRRAEDFDGVPAYEFRLPKEKNREQTC